MFLSLNLWAFTIFLSILVSTIYFKWFSSPSKIHENLPPSPWRLPVIGNFHQLGSNYHRSLSELAKKHGPIMYMHLGNVPVLVVSSVEATREILKTNELIFSDRGTSNIVRKLTYDAKTIVVSNYGEYWRQLKSLVVLHLLNNRRVQSYHQVRKEEIDLMIDMIGESCGSIVNFTELIFSFSNNLICTVALGKKYGQKQFKVMLEELMHLLIVFNIGEYIPWLSWVDRLSGLNSRTDKVIKQFDGFLESVIEENLHTNRNKSTDGKNEVVDQAQYFVDILLERQKEDAKTFHFDNDTIKAIILDMFGAGTDTTFTTLEWTFSELVRNPHVMEKLQKEVNLVAQGKPRIMEDDIDKLEYVDAVLRETMRLHPPTPLFLRASSKDAKIMGYDIKAKTRVIINTWAIGQDPTIWEEPTEFRPERFLNSHLDLKGSHFEFFPFGVGRRLCPGIQFAKTAMVLVLANVLYKFDLAPPHGGRAMDLDMSESPGLIVHRKNPLFLVATAR